MRRALAADSVTGLYALALGAASVMLTFIALDERLDLATISLLSAASAASQFVSRIFIGPLYRVLSDRLVMAGALALLLGSMLVVATVPSLTGLAIAQVLQGISRSAFWSAAQLHVLRISAEPARGMGRNQFIANSLGALGPVIAGVLAGHDPRTAAWVAGGVAALGALGCAALASLPTLPRVVRTSDNRIWQHRGLRIAAFGSLAGGCFNSVVITFAPVVLHDAGWSEPRVGAVVGVANAGLVAGALLSGRVPANLFSRAVTTATVATATGIALLSLTQPVPVAAIAGMIASGIGTGVILTLAPTLASASVPDQQSGGAVVFAGVFRAGALLGTPLLVSLATLALPTAGAMLIVGLLAAAPASWTAARRHRQF